MITNLITQYLWLALNVYFEARGEPPEGQKAVCHVTLNRMYEDQATLVKVVNAPKQFSWVDDGIKDVVTDFSAFSRVMASCIECLDDRAGGYTLEGANHYYNFHLVKPSWSKDMKVLTEIGNHRFLIGPRGRGSHLKSYK